MEIERKWLIRREDIPYPMDKLERHEIKQLYVSFSPTIRARCIDECEYILTVKTRSESAEDNKLCRNEYEMPLSRDEYESLEKLSLGRVICKDRYKTTGDDGYTREIDLFRGEFEGLAYMEIEFPDEASAAAFPDPEWVIRDVTRDGRFSNASLSRSGMPENIL